MHGSARIPSNRLRHSPASAGKRPRGKTGAFVVLAIAGLAIAALLVWLCVEQPIVSLAALILAAFVGCEIAAERRRLLRVAAARRGESICTFARSFDCRATDTRIIRAAFQEVGARVPFPIRADDRLEEDLRIDLEELEDIVVAIADRVGLSLDGYEQNPHYHCLTTVGAIVEFFAHQPRSFNRAA